jgi:hypothetical protein
MEAAGDVKPPALDPKQLPIISHLPPPPPQQHQLVRNMISALSFESVFRWNQSSSAAASSASSAAAAAATTSSLASGPAGTNAAREVSADDDDSDGARDNEEALRVMPHKTASLVPPSSSRRWSRSDPQPSLQATTTGHSAGSDETALSIRPTTLARRQSSTVHVHTSNMLHGTLDPDGGVEVVFYDCHEYGDGPNSNEFQPLDFRRDSVVMSSIRLRGGAAANLFSADDDESIEMRHKSPRPSQQQQPYRHREGAWRHEGSSGYDDSYSEHDDSSSHHPHHVDESDQHTVMSASSSLRRFLPAALSESFTAMRSSPSSKLRDHSGLRPGPPLTPCGQYPLPPSPPAELPLRFLRAGKGDPEVGLKRYTSTLEWRRENRMDDILREPCPHFELIKQHYPHFFAGRGRLGEPVFYEQPPKTNLRALKDGGVNLDVLLRHVRMESGVIVFGRSFFSCITHSHLYHKFDGLNFGCST